MDISFMENVCDMFVVKKRQSSFYPIVGGLSTGSKENWFPTNFVEFAGSPAVRYPEPRGSEYLTPGLPRVWCNSTFSIVFSVASCAPTVSPTILIHSTIHVQAGRIEHAKPD